ncbi:chromosome condensation protein CrcB [Virgibacillus indicus]|uniref:Fluoride-specific ion channel FluC n=2 Tax=Virgibacillus indicus TaxID=2024554 RepID=A0A265NB67_9BACI|nr:chromosome condensation protein CrcB [Virgibacillus indicus]
MNIFLIAIGGFFGSAARFYLSVKANKRLIGTWTANISGSFLLAVLLVLSEKEITPEWLWGLLGIGFCGSYTTFSTFGNEALQLIISNQYKKALGYILSSLIISIVIVFSVFRLFL